MVSGERYSLDVAYYLILGEIIERASGWLQRCNSENRSSQLRIKSCLIACHWRLHEEIN